MAKWSGRIGYSLSTEIEPGVWDYVISEKQSRGDVLTNARHVDAQNRIVDDPSTSNSISIVADQFALHNYMAIRYVSYAGANWKVETVQVSRPRLILYISEVYNGPTA